MAEVLVGAVRATAHSFTSSSATIEQISSDNSVIGLDLSATKDVARVLTSKIDPQDIESLRKERVKILKERRAMGSLTNARDRRLKYVEWFLDRIDDADQPSALAAVSAASERYHSAVINMQRINDELSSLIRSEELKRSNRTRK